jgi:hypothetical protein
MTAAELQSGAPRPFFDVTPVGRVRPLSEGVDTAAPSRRPWTDEEAALLVEMYPHCHSDDVAAWIGRTTSQVYQAAAARGVHKDPEYLASDTACRIQRGKQHPSMIATRFKAGQAAWNKGVPGATGLHENCRRTQFKSRSPEESRNYKPIGSLRINADGILERKVTDDRSIVPARRWTPVARLVWEEAHGAIPAGHLVVFRAGMRTTVLEEITVYRLERTARTPDGHAGQAGAAQRRNHAPGQSHRP